MNCKEAEKMISAFLSKKLDTKELEQFLLHVKNCPNCMEELTIQYLVMTGAAILEEGNSFDLRKELDDILERAWYKVRKRKLLTILSYILEVFAIMAVIIILIMVIF
ncbi:MAG: zf-HC2 domain-containing protein [Lachnospiraceae bacterium]|nr:zf-HC2 domain-containing protein [Lachnospiraceae bacterium]MDY5700489.1 zf-HC2 domain-containing protein [Lachnospiraceae bacterium]